MFSFLFLRGVSSLLFSRMVASVHLGYDGVYHNYGLPDLTKYERDLFIVAAAKLKVRENYAMEFYRKVTNPTSFVDYKTPPTNN